jgi:putative two-component system hydrogenase maturation factor HypX/HoxX
MRPVKQRILFLVSAHNGLSQRAQMVLSERGHQVDIAVVSSPADMQAAVRRHTPDLIACPFLKKLIPEAIWSEHRCLVLHPGPAGDRGPSSLDWAIELGAEEWGVTVLEANGEFDAGEVWATSRFPMRAATKASLYRHEVRHAGVQMLVEAVDRITAGGQPAGASAGPHAAVPGMARPLMSQETRAIDWQTDATDRIVRKLRAAEGHPGVLDEVEGRQFHLFGAHHERSLRGRSGEIIAQRAGAICRATVDGAVWITHLKRADTAAERYFKLPSVRALELAGITVTAPEVTVPPRAPMPAGHTYREIVCEERGGVGYLHFDFYNGAMNADQCNRLREAYIDLRSRPYMGVLVLMGGTDYFSNGIHLNLIEAAEDPAAESWRNLQAIDDLVREIIETQTHIVISALGGDAGAGGVALALAADHVLAREDAVLNPYYQHMGGLYGSEYWTYLMPRRVGRAMTERLVSAPFRPIGSRAAVAIGLIDASFGASLASFDREVRVIAHRLAHGSGFERLLNAKRRARARDEWIKPLHVYRSEELAHSYRCFFGPDRSYHEARKRFVYKLPAASREREQSIRAA